MIARRTNTYPIERRLDKVEQSLVPVGAVFCTDEIDSFDLSTGLGIEGTRWENYALCDGRNNTQDHSGRFVVGYDFDDDDYSTIGETGGEKETVLTVEQLPEHNHDTENEITGVKYDTLLTTDLGTGTVGDVDTTSDEVTVGGYEYGKIKAVGENQPHENRPPYIVMAYVKKIK